MIFHFGRGSGRGLILQNNVDQFRCLFESQQLIKEGQLFDVNDTVTCEENDDNLVTILPGKEVKSLVFSSFSYLVL